MKTFFKTGINELIPCKILESRDDDTMRVHLLADSTSTNKGTHKESEVIHTLSQNILTLDYALIRRIAIKTGYTGIVTDQNVKEIINTLATKYYIIFATELAKIETKAVNAYTSRGDSGDKYYHATIASIESIMAVLDIQLDHGVGLYPSFELDRNGKHLIEYSIEGAFKQHNNFWNHW